MMLIPKYNHHAKITSLAMPKVDVVKGWSIYATLLRIYAYYKLKHPLKQFYRVKNSRVFQRNAEIHSEK